MLQLECALYAKQLVAFSL